MTGMSERLDAIEARKDAATPGPWRTWKDNVGQRGAAVETAWAYDSDGADTELITDWCTPPDAEFIANAPEDIAYLLDLTRRQQAQLAAVGDLARSLEYLAPGDREYVGLHGYHAALIRAALEDKT